MADHINRNLNNRLVTCSLVGDLAGVASLLAQGADPHYGKSVALRIAAEQGHSECVEVLIPVSDPMAKDSLALRVAACYGHAECVKLLIPVSAPKANDSNALHLAARSGQVDCVRLLLPVSDPKVLNCNPLRLAASNGHVECFLLLMQASSPLIEINGILREALDTGQAGILSIILAHEPRLLAEIDLAATLADSVAEDHSELAALLKSIIEQQVLDTHLSPSPEATQKPSRL